MKNRITLLNSVSALLVQIVSIISGFIVPKILLTYFGSSVNGLISSIGQFLSYITLVEGGVTGVIAANLYKPLIDNDTRKISSILVTANKFYKKIGYIFIIYSVFLAIIYPSFINHEFSFIYEFALIIVLTIALFVQYMFSLTLKTLLIADKKLYIVSFTQIFMTILNIILVLISVKIYPQIHILKLISGSLYILQPIVYGYYVKCHYKINWNEDNDDRLLSERWNGFAVNIAAFIHTSTDVSILTFFTDLKTVSIYTVYTLVTNGLKGLLNSIFSGINPTLGHVYAKGNSEELNKFIDIYEYITFILVFFIFTITAMLITPFVLIFTRGITDTNYNQEMFGYLIVLSEAIYLIKTPHLSLAYVSNKFKELMVPAYLEALINIVVSLALVKKMGLTGVAIGTICGMIYRMIYQVYFTTKLINGRSQFKFYSKLILFMLFTIITILFCNEFIAIKQLSLLSWIGHALIYCLLFSFSYLLLSVFAFKNELLFLIKYIKK